MQELFAGELLPITETIGFLRCDAGRAAQAFQTWQRPIQQKRGVEVLARDLAIDFRSALLKLLPLTSVESRRFLFLPTTSDWCAFFDNGHQGTDAFATPSYLAKVLGCNALRMTLSTRQSGSEFPATIFELYGAEDREFLNYVRSISSALDGTRWTWSAQGAVQPFEEPESYRARKVQDRFTPEMLARYLAALGIRAFDQDFYVPGSTGVRLIEKVGPAAAGMREFGLAHA